MFKNLIKNCNNLSIKNELKKENFEKVIELCTKQINSDNSNIEAYLQRTFAYINIGDYDSAKEDAEICIKAVNEEKYKNLIREYLTKYINSANDYEKINEYEKALALYNICINTEENNSDILEKKELSQTVGSYYNYRADLYYKTENFEQALADYKKSIELGINNCYTYLSVADTYNKLKDYDNALKTFDKIVSMGADTDILEIVYTDRAYLYFMLNDKEKALEEFNKLIKINPKEGYDLRGDFYFRIKEYDKALSDFDKLYEEGEIYIALVNKARTYNELEQYDNAIEFFNKATKENGNDWGPYLERAKIYEKLGNNQKAEQERLIAKKLEEHYQKRVLKKDNRINI